MEVTLVDRQEMIELTYRYAQSLDMKDQALLETCLAESVRSLGSGPGPLGQSLAQGQGVVGDGSVSLSRADFAAGVIVGMRRIGATQHSFSNHRITQNSRDRATCIMYMRAMHFAIGRATAAPYECGGYYEDDLVREQEGWRIAFWRLHLFWEYGDYSVMLGGSGS
jgi:hypothetical protein